MVTAYHVVLWLLRCLSVNAWIEPRTRIMAGVSCTGFHPELDMDWIHPLIGLDWVRSFVRFIPKTEAPSFRVFFR